ncbi:MAG TPA: alpha/beta hydrolase, partial [Ilumatobacteraceae bacterium]|nr:alpha/beta hydrolase [Ilumatobacteraceae bacterium]
TGDIDLRPSFSTAGPPTLVLVGKLDKATPAKISKRIAEAIDGARLAVVDSAGHMVIIEQPDAVVGHLTSWLTDTF